MHTSEGPSISTRRGPATEPVVFIVDNNPRVCSFVERVLQASKIPSESFSSAPKFLKHYDPSRPGCLVVEARMKGMDGHRLALTRIAS